MSTVKYMKDPSVKVNKNWGHNRPAVSSKPGEYAYLSPLIREVCVQCKELNELLMNKLNNNLTDSELNGLVELNKISPDILQRVIYDQSTYDMLMKKILSGTADKMKKEKILTNITFNENSFTYDIWVYTKAKNANVVTPDSTEFNKRFTEETITLDYTDMPYERLIDTNRNEYIITSYNNMFKESLSDVKSLIIQNWTNDNVADMSYMFNDHSSLTLLDLGDNFNTSNVADMSYIFNGCEALTSLNLGDDFNTSNVTNMNSMFNGCSKIQSLPLGNSFNTSNVMNMNSMFNGCVSLQSLTLGDNFNTSNVTDMSYMFNGCSKIQSLTLGNSFNTSNVTNMNSMFNGCSNLQSLTLGNKFNTSKVTNMDNMFNGCSSLKELALCDKFDTSKVTNTNKMFNGCPALNLITLYQSAENIIIKLPSGIWEINDNEKNTIKVYQSSEVDWDILPPKKWDNEPWKLHKIRDV